MTPFSKFPGSIEANTYRSDLKYVRLSKVFSLVGHVSPGVDVVATITGSEGTFTICAGDQAAIAALPDSVQTGAVYSLQPNGPPAVPTGLVFVRFREGVRADEQVRDLARVGYEIVRKMPHSAWVRAATGRVADALRGIARLKRLANVVNVEPQMLTESVRRMGPPGM